MFKSTLRTWFRSLNKLAARSRDFDWIGTQRDHGRELGPGTAFRTKQNTGREGLKVGLGPGFKHQEPVFIITNSSRMTWDKFAWCVSCGLEYWSHPWLSFEQVCCIVAIVLSPVWEWSLHKHWQQSHSLLLVRVCCKEKLHGHFQWSDVHSLTMSKVCLSIEGQISTVV